MALGRKINKRNVMAFFFSLKKSKWYIPGLVGYDWF